MPKPDATLTRLPPKDWAGQYRRSAYLGDMHRSPAPPDVQTVALLGHDLRAALSEVIGGLRLVDTEQLPPELA